MSWQDYATNKIVVRSPGGFTIGPVDWYPRVRLEAMNVVVL